MKRMHVHVGVEHLDRSIDFYSALFAAPPVVVKSDYAKWMLEDPRVNFAISTRGKQPGLDHLGHFFWQRLKQRQIGYCNTPTGLENARGFLQCLLWLRDVMEHQHQHRDVEPRIVDGQRFELAAAKVDVAEACQSALRRLQHRR